MRILKRASLAAVAALVLGAGALVAAPAWAGEVFHTENGIDYRVDTTDVAAGAQVVFFDESTTDVVIPDTVNVAGIDYDVVNIAGQVFMKKGLTSVIIGNNVTTINERAFQQNDLGTVTIPDSVTWIRQNAFGFTNLTDLTLGNSVATIEYGAFSSNDLQSVIIPASVNRIDGYAFQNNSELSSVTFLGAAPTVYPADDVQSFDTSNDSLVLYYPWAQDASIVAGGYTEPEWQGYPTQTVRPEMTIAKTVDASYVRVYDWEFVKTGTVGEITVGEDSASAAVDYTVTATPKDYRDDYHVLTGTITVTNETVEPRQVVVADVPAIGVDATCNIFNSAGAPTDTLSLAGSESVTLDYVCSFDGTPADGTNTATVSWGTDNSASVTEDVVFIERTASFKDITVVDDQGNPDGPYVELGTASWNSDRLLYVFDYTVTHENMPIGECTTVTNTAMIAEMERTTTATVEICPEAAVTPEPTDPVTPEPTDPVTTNPIPPALVETGAGTTDGIVSASLLLMLAGSATVLAARRARHLNA